MPASICIDTITLIFITVICGLIVLGSSLIMVVASIRSSQISRDQECEQLKKLLKELK